MVLRGIEHAARITEPDRALAARLAPRAVRDDLIVLAAFLGDVARIPRVVADPRLGEIRLQWWVETIESFATGALSGHPIADALAEVVARRGLDAAEMIAVVEARFVEFAETPVRDQYALQDYLDGTEGAAFRLAARILCVPQTDATHAVLSAAGRAYGLVRLLQSLPRQLSRGRILLPADWPEVSALRDAASRGASTATTLDGVLARGARAARQHQATLHSFAAQIPHSLVAAILPCALIEPYLQALQGAGYQSDRPAADITPLARVWRLWRAHRRGHI